MVVGISLTALANCAPAEPARKSKRRDRKEKKRKASKSSKKKKSRKHRRSSPSSSSSSSSSSSEESSDGETASAKKAVPQDLPLDADPSEVAQFKAYYREKDGTSVTTTSPTRAVPACLPAFYAAPHTNPRRDPH